ncbi:hypothetical protein GUB10_09665 [Salegentibacter sp. BLCTC]|uniref:hypothetical protein n=1 Tax=Salegentibacter sp. BLCTC TaxID=2697368 RepID=UPI00187BC38E|nr:hypothetical protein [Salegentibacter sp. BLCTC]MBE7640597.1 hypothetical protein [Salegentibacter sp. BLCTC]
MMKNYLLIFCLLIISILKAEDVVSGKAVSPIPKEIIAGEKLVLEFNNIHADARLLVNSSYGKTMLIPQIVGNSVIFEVPGFISEKAGTIKWKLLGVSLMQSGKVMVLPELQPKLIENYFGPRSIQAGGKDYSMLVSIPTDRFDNPLSDDTGVEISEFFQGVLKTDSIEIKNMFAWKNITSKEKVGNIIVSGTSKGLQTKEMISQVYPSVATDFKLAIQREHSFADGNQVTRVKTSVIKDEFNNLVGDGTFVEFLIIDSENIIQKTYAATINGVATAQLLHPEKPITWKISANITGMAKSNEVVVDYEPVIEDFNVELDLENNFIKVGPLTSFLGQYIPDGTEVVLKILDSNNEIHSRHRETSKAGFAIFKPGRGINYADSFTFKIETLGVTKSIQ